MLPFVTWTSGYAPRCDITIRCSAIVVMAQSFVRIQKRFAEKDVKIWLSLVYQTKQKMLFNYIAKGVTGAIFKKTRSTH